MSQFRGGLVCPPYLLHVKSISGFLNKKDLTMTIFLRRATILTQLLSTVYFVTCLEACKPTPALEVLLMSGDATPDGQNQFDIPLLSDAVISGDYVSVWTKLKNNHHVLVVNKKGAKSKIAIETGMETPSGHTLWWFNYGSPAVNQKGLTAVVMDSALSSNPNGRETELLSTQYTGNLNFLISSGDIEPEGNGELMVNTAVSPSVNSSGQIAVSTTLANSSGGASDDEAIFSVDNVTGAIRKIVREGDNLPDGSGQFDFTYVSGAVFYHPIIANDGSVAFISYLLGTGISYDARGIFIGNGSGITEIARYGDTMPGGEQLRAIKDIDYSSSGVLAFVAGTTGWGATVFLHSESGIHKIAGPDTVTDTGDTINSAYPFVKVSNSGQVAFMSLDYPNQNEGIFIADVASTRKIALGGDEAPEGHGIFSSIQRDYAMSDSGLIAFHANLRKDGKAQEAIYFYDNKQLQEVISTFDSIDGSPVIDLDLGGSTDSTSDAINDKGDIVFKFQLADGRIGVAVWRH